MAENPWSLSPIPPGDAGVAVTVGRMQQLLREAVQDQRLVLFAQELSRSAGQAPSDLILAQLVQFVRSKWVFRNDPVAVRLAVELVKTPDRLLSEYVHHGSMLGDCDDASMILAALCAALGYRTRFVVVQRFVSSPGFDHIYLEAWNGAGWVPLDGVAFGKSPFFRPQHVPGRAAYYLNA